MKKRTMCKIENCLKMLQKGPNAEYCAYHKLMAKRERERAKYWADKAAAAAKPPKKCLDCPVELEPGSSAKRCKVCSSKRRRAEYLERLAKQKAAREAAGDGKYSLSARKKNPLEPYRMPVTASVPTDFRTWREGLGADVCPEREAFIDGLRGRG